MKAESSKPALSAILWTPDTYWTLRRTVSALREQTVRDRIEVILVGPSSSALDGAASDLDEFAAYQLVVADAFTKAAHQFSIDIGLLEEFIQFPGKKPFCFFSLSGLIKAAIGCTSCKLGVNQRPVVFVIYRFKSTANVSGCSRPVIFPEPI